MSCQIVSSEHDDFLSILIALPIEGNYRNYRTVIIEWLNSELEDSKIGEYLFLQGYLLPILVLLSRKKNYGRVYEGVLQLNNFRAIHCAKSARVTP